MDSPEVGRIRCHLHPESFVPPRLLPQQIDLHEQE